jgi:hypothetical protein
MMPMLGPFDRSHAVRWQQTLHQVAPRGAASPAAPPPPTVDVDTPDLRRRPDMARAHFLTHTLLGPASGVASVVAELEAAVDERVVAWSPSMYTTSRKELVVELLDRDDALADIEVVIIGEAMTDAKIYVEWRLTARFENVGFIDSDILVEPSHLPIEAAGVLVFSFVGSRVSRIECYYDGFAVLEQLLVAGPGS